MINKITTLFQNPYLGTSMSNWFRLVIGNKGIDLDRIPLALFTVIVLLLLTPFRLFAGIRRRSAVKSASLSEPPIFVIGHWRSGTTHLHYLMSASGRFGGINQIDAVFPFFSLWLRNKNSFLNKLLRKLSFTRPMDNVKFDIDSPAEEEFSIANTTPYSFFHGLIFRKRFREYFRKFALLEDLSEEELILWEQTYHDVILQSSVCSGGKRLLLKNPYNTSKVCKLLSMYPGARFVYIYRNPYDVYVSTMNMHKKTDCFALQKVSSQEMRENVLYGYKSLLDKFYEEGEQVPEGVCSCVKYEDLVENPLEEMSRIYREIGLDGFDVDSKGMIEYLESVKDYTRNSFGLSDDERRKIKKEWGKYILLMGYETENSQKCCT
ncbi:MAG: sulfotransferase [Chlorobiales bacterium]|nr:sulfotransferase [Chlorobiales bacterium]